MTDKNKKLTKRVSKFIWLISLVLLVTFFVALFGIQAVANKINSNPQNYPDDWGMIGLGIIAIMIYAGIFQGIFLVLSIPTSILKNKSLKEGRTNVADSIFTILMALVALPAIFMGMYFVVLTAQFLAYGLGIVFVPYSLAILLHIGVEVLLIKQLINCWPKKQKAVTEEVAEVVE